MTRAGWRRPRAFFQTTAETRYCFQIIDPAAKRPYSRRTSICGENSRVCSLRR